MSTNNPCKHRSDFIHNARSAGSGSLASLYRASLLVLLFNEECRQRRDIDRSPCKLTESGHEMTVDDLASHCTDVVTCAFRRIHSFSRLSTSSHANRAGSARKRDRCASISSNHHIIISYRRDLGPYDKSSDGEHDVTGLEGSREAAASRNRSKSKRRIQSRVCKDDVKMVRYNTSCATSAETYLARGDVMSTACAFH